MPTDSNENGQPKIQPIEELMFAGLLGRLTSVFGGSFIVVTADDKTRQMAKVQNGNKLTYPYGFVSIQSYQENATGYNVQYLARNGLDIITNDGSTYRVHVIPTRYQLEVEFVTNDYAAVSAFRKRWLFARRLGLLKFNVEYGNFNFMIDMELSPEVNTPMRANTTEVETSYSSTATITLSGYDSESRLRHTGTVQKVEVDGNVFDSSGALEGFQFMAFKTKE